MASSPSNLAARCREPPAAGVGGGRGAPRPGVRAAGLDLWVDLACHGMRGDVHWPAAAIKSPQQNFIMLKHIALLAPKTCPCATRHPSLSPSLLPRGVPASGRTTSACTTSPLARAPTRQVQAACLPLCVCMMFRCMRVLHCRPTGSALRRNTGTAVKTPPHRLTSPPPRPFSCPGEALEPADAARLFEEKLKAALLAEDGQLALSRLAGTTVSTLMPKIETQGQVGRSRDMWAAGRQS